MIGYFLLLYIALLGYGYTQAFWGYKLWRARRFLSGLLGGILTGGIMGLMVAGVPGAVVLGLVLGILSGIVCVVWEKVSVFLTFFGYGFWLTLLLLVLRTLKTLNLFSIMGLLFGGGLTAAVIPAVIVGCIVGVIGIFIARAWIIFSTAFTGGIVCTVCMFPAVNVFALACILIIPAGIAYQQETTGISLKKGAAGKEQTAADVTPQMQPQAAQTASTQVQPQAAQTASTQVQPQTVQAASPQAQPQAAPDVKPQAVPPAGKTEPAPRFCSSCGNRLSGGEAFCPQCGNRTR